MDLHHQFEVAAPVDAAWPAFLDVPRVAPCMPGAEVTDVIDERHVKGGASVKVGPVNLRFNGEAEIVEVDDVNRSALLKGQGSDAKGRGNAAAEVRFSVSEPGAGKTLVDVHTSLTLTGSVAQYGRAAGLIDEIANQLIADFVQCLEAKLAPATPEATGEPETEPTSAKPPAVAPASGLKLFFRALLSLIKKWFRRS